MKITARVLVALLTLLLTVALLLQIPAVQTAVAGKVVSKVEDKFDADIQFESISILPFKTLVVKDLTITDLSPLDDGTAPVRDTLLSASSLTARFTLKGLISKQGIKLAKVDADDLRLALVTELDDKYKSNLARVFRLEKKDKPDSGKDILSIRKINVKDLHLTMDNHKLDPQKFAEGINWARLDAKADLQASNFKIKGKVISGTIDHATLQESSGLNVSELSGSAKAGNGLGTIKDLHLRDLWSDLNIKQMDLVGDGPKALSRFVTDMHLDAELKPSTLDFRTLAYFSPALKGNNTIAQISSGTVSGTVDDLDVSDVTLTDLTSGLSGAMDVHVSGLPSMDKLSLDCTLDGVTTTVQGLSEFLSSWSKGQRVSLPDIAPGETFTLDGRAVGSLKALKTQAILSSSMGRAAADIIVENIASQTSPMRIKGRLGTDNLDLGQIIEKDFIGPCSMNTTLEATLSKGSPSVRIDSLGVSRLNLLGYDYSGIEAAGTFSQNAFDGRIVCNDPNINFMFQGLFNLSRRSANALYRFYAYLAYADLHSLGIDSREISKVSGANINANYRRVARGDLVGNIDATSMVLEGADGRHETGDIHIGSRTSNGRHEIRLTSGFADGSFNGTGSITDFIQGLQDLTVRKELTALCGSATKKWASDSYSLDFNFHDSRDLLSFIAPGAYIADSTSLSLRVTPGGRLSGRMSSPRLAYKGKYIKGLAMDMDNGDDALNLTLTGSNISLGPGLSLDSDAIMLYANDNSVGAGLTFSDAEELNRGELYLTADLSGSKPGAPALNVHSLASSLCLNGQEWRFDPAAIRYRDGELKLEQMRIRSDEQSIVVSGGYSPDRADTLRVSIDKLGLDLVDRLTEQDLGIGGLASGSVMLLSPTKDGLCLDASIVCEDAQIGGRPAGTLTLTSSTDTQTRDQRFALRNMIDSHSGIDAVGSYNLKDKSLTLNAGLDRFDLGYASPLMTSVFSEMGGALSGNVSASGPLQALDLRSEGLRISDGLLRIAFTNVPYTLNGPLHLDSQGVHFDSIAARDRYEGTATISGGILYDHFKDIRMDTRIRMEGLEVLDTDERDNPSFYGNVFGNGRMSITGPLSSLLMDIDASTTKQGHFHIPLGSVASAGKSDLLVFKEPERKVYIDPYDEMMSTLQEVQKKSSELGVRLRVGADPQTEAHLEIDKSVGNELVGRGSGNIALEIFPSRDIFNINGDYTLSSGGCHINILGITSKDFTIQDGSSINFGGDIMDSALDIEARYNIKTSLSSLIADTTSVSTRRNVECGVRISDRLRNPHLDFSIDVPDLDPATKSRVESALSTDDKVQKQFMALLVTGNFLPDDQSGIVNNTNILYSNVADIMAGQVNNILEKLEIPLDLGLKYQESGTGTSIFDVALSTQLFNNRVVVGGNIGNRQQRSSGNEDVVGDLDIEIKMDRSGAVRLNLFSHSADEYTNYLDNSQRNGVGVAYQKEFNSLKAFLTELFTPKKDRQEATADDDAGKVTINIQ